MSNLQSNWYFLQSFIQSFMTLSARPLFSLSRSLLHADTAVLPEMLQFLCVHKIYFVATSQYQHWSPLDGQHFSLMGQTVKN